MLRIPDSKFINLLFWGLIVVTLGVASPHIIALLEALGHQIPQENIAKDYVLALLWASILGISIFFWPVSNLNKKCLLWGWLAKVVVALGVMLFYENYYGIDSFHYFDLSREVGLKWGGFEDITSSNDIIVNIARIQRILLTDSYHAIKISFAMFGLIGIFLFYRAAVIFLQRENSKIFYLLALFPGILFWSSTLGKDPVVFLGIAIYVHSVVCLYRLNQLRYLAEMAFGMTIAIFIRPWLVPIMLFPLLVLFWRGIHSYRLKIVLLIFIIASIVFSAGPFMQRLSMESAQDIVMTADMVTQGFVGTPGGSTQDLNVKFDSVGSIVKFLPYGAFTALFRPLPGEVMNPFGSLAGLESLLLIVLLVLAIKRTSFRELKEPLVMWAILFIVTWASVNGIVSSANFGVAVRYRLQILPVLLGVLVYLSRKRQKHRVEKLNRHKRR